MSLEIRGVSDVNINLNAFRNSFLRGLEIQSEAFAGRLEAKAVKNRKWVDRTGAARNSIAGVMEKDGSGIDIVLGIGVEYGKWLELANGGKYRLIQPTVDSSRKEFLDLPRYAMQGAKI